MKSIIKWALCIMVVAFAAVSCKQKEAPVQEAKPEVYVPKHVVEHVDLNNIKTYNYINAPAGAAAISVVVNYRTDKLYEPIEIKYSYKNGDTRTYIVPKEFGLWENEAGRLRVVADNTTVWLQGQTKAGKFCEFVFYGDPKHNGKKITPNSYRNLPAGEIVYR